jgi:protoheme IX farnesyltransferase
VTLPSGRTTPGTGPDDAPPARAARHKGLDLWSLTKPRLNLLALFTTWGGVYLARPGVPTITLLHTLIGTALVAGGAAALNQVWERDTDKLMRRTRLRPLPDGRLAVAESAAFGVSLSIIGLAELALRVNLASATVAALTLLSYVVVYTPLKTRTSLATLIGAVPGALPPVIGWAAATGEVPLQAWVLFGIVFFWQMPHFLAIAWLYRDEYREAGIPLLPTIETDGRRTGQQALIYAAALWPVSLMPMFVGLVDLPYSVVATALGFFFIWLSLEFARERSTRTARRLFLYSIIYLPLLWGALCLDRLWL